KCGVLNLYIPNAANIRGAMKNYIREHFTGANHRELALRLGINEGSVYKMLAE
ncbi:MAG: hypothetical protein JNL32_09580, partial [Candidatus Kapabacteria bacterium]|nr:hypothetical protein [Candidatus Kapabacteria bacterium]